MEYIDRKDTHLKLHRLMQFLGWPLLIVANGIAIATCVGSLFSLNLPWSLKPLETVQQFLTTLTKGALTPLLTSVILIVIALVFLVLDFYSWIGSFKWRKFSYRSWLVALFLSLVMFLGMGAFVEFVIIRGNNLAVVFGQSITSPTLKTQLIWGLRIITGLALIVIVMVLYLMILYYFKRRKLYKADDYYEEPENTPEYGKPEVTSPIQPLPQTPAPTPAPAASPELVLPETPPQQGQETIVLDLPESAPEVPERAHFMDADHDGTPDEDVADIR